MMPDGMPESAYLAWHYYDWRTKAESWYVYYEDGRIEAHDGRTWWSVCQFSPEQVAAAKAAIQSSGLIGAEDWRDPAAYDTARVTYHWRLDDQSGEVTNWAYPASEHPAVEALESIIEPLEEEAGCENEER